MCCVVFLSLTAGPDRCAVERFISGPYRKHNNNFGYVSEHERNTPQAFSHFSYEASERQILICDIQGVGDLYTDPQIHSLDGIGFGKGNMGDRGFTKFLSSHRCNAICKATSIHTTGNSPTVRLRAGKYLRLPPVNPKDDADAGTIPSTRYMVNEYVDPIKVEPPLTLNSPAPSQLLGELLKSGGGRARTRTKGDDKMCWCTVL